MTRLGIDIGGTFTDLTGIDPATGELFHLKTLTTPEEPARGVIDALDTAGLQLDTISFLVHGTTVAINVVIEGKGAPTAVIATKGFRDLLELRRGARTRLMDPLMDNPPVFIPKRSRVEVTERVHSDGRVSVPLDEDEVMEVLKGLRSKGLQSVAVCLLNSYANSVHERRIGELIEEHFPEFYYTLSADLVPEMKEFDRTSTTALNSYIQPIVHRYLTHLESEMGERGLKTKLQLMQSNGGLMTADEAVRRPIHILESGPAGGSIAGVYIGKLIGTDNLITLDMGGTTAKASVIEGGIPLSTVEFELFEEPNQPGSGWPIRVPMIDIVEIGAGGGSIAWIDDSGNLQVGPKSAGAAPGPVCYGRGGMEPTITDANAILGRLDSLLGGDFTMDVEKARQVTEERIAKPLGITVEEAAAGILEISGAKTADLIREVTIARGRDPRDFSLVVYGGAGPLIAAHVVSEMGIAQAVIPPAPGNFSALGLISTDIIHDLVRTYSGDQQRLDLQRVNSLFQEMEEELETRLAREGVAPENIVLQRSADMKYKGQFHILNVSVNDGTLTVEDLSSLRKVFEDEHLRLYTYSSDGEPTDLVNLRVRGRGNLGRPELPRVDVGTAEMALVDTRVVYFRGMKEPLDCKIYKRELLGSGSQFDGPAVVEEKTSTTLVPPGFNAKVDDYGNVIISIM